MEIVYRDHNGYLQRIRNQKHLDLAYEWARQNNLEQMDLYVCKTWAGPIQAEYFGEGLMYLIFNAITYNELRRIYTAHFIQNAKATYETWITEEHAKIEKTYQKRMEATYRHRV